MTGKDLKVKQLGCVLRRRIGEFNNLFLQLEIQENNSPRYDVADCFLSSSQKVWQLVIADHASLG